MLPLAVIRAGGYFVCYRLLGLFRAYTQFLTEIIIEIADTLIVIAGGRILQMAERIGVIDCIQRLLYGVVLFLDKDFYQLRRQILFHTFYLPFCQHTKVSACSAFSLPK